MVQRPHDIEALEEKSEAQAKPRGGLLGKYTNVEILAYILAGISALGATWSSIGRLFADSIENMTWVKELKEKRDTKLEDGFTKLRKNLIKDPSNTAKYQQDYKNEQRDTRRAYKKAYSHILQNQMGVYNTYDKWFQLPRHQKIATFMTIAGVLSIAGLALYTIGKERTTRKKWEEEREKRIAEARTTAEHVKVHEESLHITPDEQPSLPGNKADAVLAERRNAASTESLAPGFF